jgi:hypothetical protein
MWNRRRKTVEWVWRGGELVAVFAAMSWALLWAARRRNRPAPWRPSRHLDVGGRPLGSNGLGRGARFRGLPTAAVP